MAVMHSISLIVTAIICGHFTSQEAFPIKIGLISGDNVTVSFIQTLLIHPLTVETMPSCQKRSPYACLRDIYEHMESGNFLAVIGPYHRAVSLAAEGLHVPYLSVTEVESRPVDYTLQIIPDMDDIAQAVFDIARAYRWSKVSVFYDDDNGVRLLEKLMTDHIMTVRGWRLDPFAKDGDVKRCLVNMRKVLVEHSVVLCNARNTEKILQQARGLAMLSTPPYQWLFYEYGQELHDLLMAYHDIAVNFTVLSVLPFPSQATDSQLLYTFLTEALSLLMSAYTQASQTSKASDATAFRENITHIMRQSDSSCQIPRPIAKQQRPGSSSLPPLSSLTGSSCYTGHVAFNSDRKRDNFTLYITGLTGDQITTVGQWYSSLDGDRTRLQLNGSLSNPNRSTPFPLKGSTAKVVMIQERPFTMLKRDYVGRKGNDRFQGFAVDLIAEVAKNLHFQYEIYLVPDGNFGSKLENGEWNGMIGELLSGEAAMSVAPLSINSDREQAVDFTKPFMTRYINVLMRLPRRHTSYFEFLNPLSPVVWICTLCSFVVVSIVLYMLERIGSSSRSAAITPAAHRASRISLREAFWFIFGSLLQGNTDSSPCTIPGRILTSAWWFFALILISSYTANLAAFLTVKKINTPIKSVSDLAQQSKIKYGTVKSSGVMAFFKNTKIEHFAKMWDQMSEIDPDSMVENTSVGLQKVKEEDYAFFWDTTVNKYQTIIDCDVMEIGPSFDPKGFGIGVPPGASYRDDLSMAILNLSDTGKLHELETRYWGSRNCPDPTKPSSDETSELQIENVAGVFFILVGGIVIAAVVCLGEYVGHALLRASKLGKRASIDKGSNSEAFL